MTIWQTSFKSQRLQKICWLLRFNSEYKPPHLTLIWQHQGCFLANVYFDMEHGIQDIKYCNIVFASLFIKYLIGWKLWYIHSKHLYLHIIGILADICSIWRGVAPNHSCTEIIRYFFLFPNLNDDYKGRDTEKSFILLVVYTKVFQFLVYFENISCGHLKYRYGKKKEYKYFL